MTWNIAVQQSLAWNFSTSLSSVPPALNIVAITLCFGECESCLSTNYLWVLSKEHSGLTISAQQNKKGDAGQTLFYNESWCYVPELLGKRLAPTGRWCNRETTTATCGESWSVHHVNKFAQRHLERNVLHRACKPVGVWWNLTATADRELIVNDFYLHMQVCLSLLWSVLTLGFSPPWVSGIADDTGSTLISIP